MPLNTTVVWEVTHSGRSTQYTYDTLYRLTQESIADADNGDYSASYSYDATGNRIESIIDGVTTQYTYDENDRLMQQGGYAYTYDPQGNTLTETLDGNTTTYAYNSQQELVSTTNADGITTFTYNPDGIRTEKAESGLTTTFTVDSNRDYAQVLQESNGTETRAYVYGDDLISQATGAATQFHHYDGLGSTRALTDSTGSITDTYNYEAFGQILIQTGTTANSYLYTGEQFDQSLNQYYLRARYYNQGIGRFTQMDSWQGRSYDPITLHKYLYANADPVSYTDPTGNFGLSSIGVSLRINGILSTSATTVGRSAISRVLTGAGRDAFGIIGEEIIGFAKEALLNVLVQELAGPGFQNAGAKGTAAHQQFEKLIENINDKYKKYGYTIHAEIFRDKDSKDPAKKRAKNSLGIDVEVRDAKGKSVLSFDLKTGRGTSKKRNRKLQGVFGTDIIEIFVSKKQ